MKILLPMLAYLLTEDESGSSLVIDTVPAPRHGTITLHKVTAVEADTPVAEMISGNVQGIVPAQLSMKLALTIESTVEDEDYGDAVITREELPFGTRFTITGLPADVPDSFVLVVDG